MDNKNIEIGKRIKQRREELGMTQEELGKELGLNKSTIQRYETGKIAKIKLPVIHAIAKQLRVNPEWLVLKTDERCMIMTVGDIICSRRKELGLTLEDVGNAIGVSKSTVKKWENGYITNMRKDKIEPLAKVLKIDPLVFIHGVPRNAKLKRVWRAKVYRVSGKAKAAMV